MSSKQTVTIKDYHNGGGDLNIEVKMSVISEKMVGLAKVVGLKITRQPDKHSMRLGMFAHIRNTQAGYQSLGFAQLTLTFETYSAGKLLTRYLTYFYDVAVTSVMRVGDEEEITFIARKKSPTMATSNIVLVP